MPTKEVQAQDQDEVGKLLSSLVGQKISIMQLSGKQMAGILKEGNAEYLKLEQGSTETKKYTYIFKAGISELSVLERP